MVRLHEAGHNWTLHHLERPLCVFTQAEFLQAVIKVVENVKISENFPPDFDYLPALCRHVLLYRQPAALLRGIALPASLLDDPSPEAFAIRICETGD